MLHSTFTKFFFISYICFPLMLITCALLLNSTSCDNTVIQHPPRMSSYNYPAFEIHDFIAKGAQNFIFSANRTDTSSTAAAQEVSRISIYYEMDGNRNLDQSGRIFYLDASRWAKGMKNLLLQANETAHAR